jgi:hypothetical protein
MTADWKKEYPTGWLDQIRTEQVNTDAGLGTKEKGGESDFRQKTQADLVAENSIQLHLQPNQELRKRRHEQPLPNHAEKCQRSIFAVFEEVNPFLLLLLLLLLLMTMIGTLTMMKRDAKLELPTEQKHGQAAK